MRGEITGKSPVDNKVEEEGTDEPELLMAERRTSRAEGEADLVGTTRVRPSKTGDTRFLKNWAFVDF